jgi:hypothetical protein
MKKTKKNVSETTGTTHNCSNPEFISWADATVDEKIKRVRYVVKDMMKELAELQKKNEELTANFYNHKHFNDMLMQQMTHYGNSLFAGNSKEEDNRSDKERWF